MCIQIFSLFIIFLHFFIFSLFFIFFSFFLFFMLFKIYMFLSFFFRAPVCSLFSLHHCGLQSAHFFLSKIHLNVIFLYHSVHEIMVPCTPQLDVVMRVHLIRCHPGSEDVIQLRRSSISIFCTISVDEGHLPFVVTARPGRCRFAFELFHDLAPHQLLAASMVIFASWPLKLRRSARSCDTLRLSLVHAEPIALQLINHISPAPSSFRGSHLDHVRPAHRMPG